MLPYSYTLSAPQVRALPRALADAIGRGADPRVKPTLPLGADYTYYRFRFFVSTANRRPLSMNSSVEVGRF